MPGDTITLTSTTDTENDVKAALGVAVEPAPVVAETVTTADADPTPDQEEADAESQALQDGAAAARRKKGRLQSRIDELTEKASRATGESAALKAQVAIYEQRLAQMAGLQPQPAPRQTVAPQVDVTLPAKPQVGDFETYEEYTEAIADWKYAINNASRESEIDKRVEARLKAERDTQTKNSAAEKQKAQSDRYRAKETEARAKYLDFDERVNNPELRASNLVLQLLVDSEHGPEVAYYIATHKEIADKLWSLGESGMALKEFGKIEARVESALEAAAAPTAARSDAPVKDAPPVVPPAGTQPARPVATTKAPDPITPVGGGTQATVTTDPDQMSYQEFRTWRASQERKRAGLK